MITIPIARRPIIIPLLDVIDNTALNPSLHKPVNIVSGDYIVRSLTASDVDEVMLSWFKRPDMLRGLNLNDLGFNESKLKRFVSGFDNYRNYILGIIDQKNDKQLVGFYTIDVNLTHKVGSITTGLGDVTERGKRTLWATIDAVLDHFYSERDIEKFTARILARNHAMLFNFKNNPRFSLEAHLKNECIAPNGKRVDLLVFASHKKEDAHSGYYSGMQNIGNVVEPNQHV